MRGGKWRLRLKVQYVQTIPLPSLSSEDRSTLARLGKYVSSAAIERASLIKAFLHRCSDLSSASALPDNFAQTLEGDFDQFRENLRKRKIQISVVERDAWENYFKSKKSEVALLHEKIRDIENEFNERIYLLFGLHKDEIALIEEEMSGQY